MIFDECLFYGFIVLVVIAAIVVVWKA